MNMKYFSQYGQDKWLIDNIFKGKQNGYFIDCGCSHYSDISNTYTLEQYFGWRGIGIDLIQENVDAFNKHRESIGVCAVLSDVGGKEVEIVDAGVTTGVCDNYSNIYVQESKKKGNKTRIVTTKTLTDVLSSVSAPNNIDLFSLDVEGHELKVLQGLDFDRYNVSVICVEKPNTNNVFDKEYASELIEFLKSKNYTKLDVLLSIDWVFTRIRSGA